MTLLVYIDEACEILGTDKKGVRLLLQRKLLKWNKDYRSFSRAQVEALAKQIAEELEGESALAREEQPLGLFERQGTRASLVV